MGTLSRETVEAMRSKMVKGSDEAQKTFKELRSTFREMMEKLENPRGRSRETGYWILANGEPYKTTPAVWDAWVGSAPRHETTPFMNELSEKVIVLTSFSGVDLGMLKPMMYVTDVMYNGHMMWRARNHNVAEASASHDSAVEWAKKNLLDAQEEPVQEVKVSEASAAAGQN